MRVRSICVAAAAAAALWGAWASPASALPPGFEQTESVDGLTFPTAVDWAPDGRMFIAEKAGRVRVARPDGTLEPKPVVDISDHVNRYNDRGLLGIAVDADFAANRYLYLLYVYEPNPLTPSDTGPKTSRLTRVTVGSDGTVEHPSAPETVILGKVGTAPCPTSSNTADCIPADGPSHAVGTVRADPDGTLWVGSGDATFSRMFRPYDDRSFAGKILHVDRSGRGLPGHSFCPQDGDLSHVCTKIYAKGFRNPFRFSLRPGKGPVVGDVGSSTHEEIDLIRSGGNYGWPCYEGRIRTPEYKETPECAAEYAKEGTGQAALNPVYDYPHGGVSSAIIGGPVYPGGSYPDEYDGDIFFGDLSGKYMKRLKLGAGDTFGSVVDFDPAIDVGVDLELGPNGNLFLVDIAGGNPGHGRVLQLQYSPDNRTPTARAGGSPTSGKAPLAVQFTGSTSSDPDGDRLTYEWDFGDGSPTQTTVSPSHTYQRDGSYSARLKVSDGRGKSDTDTVVVTVGNTPPSVLITAPVRESLFRAGSPVNLAGAAQDEQEGNLPGTALSWRVILHHGSQHIHDFATLSGSGTSFVPGVDHDADSWYDVTLTATDSGGLSTSKTVSVHPKTVALSLGSSPQGASLIYDASERSAPFAVRAATGHRAQVAAQQSFTKDGCDYTFESWSDGGARLHDLTIPATDLSLTARYRSSCTAVTPSPQAAVVPAFLDASGPTLRLGRRALDRRRGILKGTAEDPGGVARVGVALRAARRAGSARCRWWQRSLRRLRRKRTSCRRPVWLPAKLHRSGAQGTGWRLSFGARLPRGRYALLLRAVDGAGNVTDRLPDGRPSLPITVKGR